MKDRKLTIQQRNEALAQFLGWYKENETSERWCEKKGSSIKIVYNENNNLLGTLPFRYDMNYLLKVLDRLKATVLPSDSNAGVKVNQFVWDRFTINLNSFHCSLYQWMGKKNGGWRMMLNSNENLDLAIMYIIGENCKDWQEGLFLFLSDIVLTIQAK
jgi:hypothetical protein